MFNPIMATMTTELTARDQRIAELERELAAAKAALTRIKTWASHGEEAPFNDKAVGYEDARRWVLILADGEK